MTYAVYAASLASGLAITPIVVHALGTSAYGLWAFIGSVTVYLGLLDFGVGPSIIRFGAVQRGRQKPEETNELASVGLALYGAVGLVSVAAGIGLAWLVPAVIDLPNDLVSGGVDQRDRAAVLVAHQGEPRPGGHRDHVGHGEQQRAHI